MTPARIGLTVFLGTVFGLIINYPHVAPEGYLVVGAVHGGFVWFLALIILTGLKILGLVSEDEAPGHRRRK